MADPFLLDVVLSRNPLQSNGISQPDLVASREVLSRYFGQQWFSIDAVAKFKPAAETYKYVADKLVVKTSELSMIAAHPWDLIGAKAAGCEVAFIQ